MSTLFWLGSDSSLDDYKKRQMRLDAAVSEGLAKPEPADGYQLYGNVAVVDIQGPLTNTDSIWNMLFGMTSYNSIREGLMSAASNPKVEEIVLNIDSPGGSATGVSDVGNLIRRINAQLPVTSFASGTAASAALWLGTAAGRMYASETSSVGSLGVIATVMDHTAELEKEGIKPTIIRSGPKKALGGPYEVLTDAAKAEIQSKIDHLHGIFVDTIAEHRGLSTEFVRHRIADGSEFIGQQAVDVGLIDGITTLDALVAGLQSRHDTLSTTHPPLRKDSTMAKRKLLSEQQIALIAEGVDPSVALEAAPGLETPPATSADPDPVEPPAAAATSNPDPVESAPPAADLTTYLQTQLAERTSEITKLSVQVAELERELSGYRAHDTELKAIVMGRIQNMQVGLGGIATDLSKLSTEALLSQHAQVAEAFAKSFPVGGVALQAEEEKEETPITPMAQARLRAVKPK